MAELKPRVWDGVVKQFTPPDTPACNGILGVPYVEPGRVTEATARAFQEENCFTCPVFVACARHAMNHEPYGTWGLTEVQRGSLGGVVAQEWANRPMDPHGTIDELVEAGVPLDTLTEIASAPGLRNQPVLHAIASTRTRRRSDQQRPMAA